ncbi:MAG: SpoVG family protein [Candidatus Hydrothermarchaeales archaeon]
MAEVTDVRIYTMEGTGNLKAYATVTLDEAYVVHGLKVLEGETGLWVSMPASKNKKGEYKDVFHPISKEARGALVDAVIEGYESMISRGGAEGEAKGGGSEGEEEAKEEEAKEEAEEET